MPYTARPAGQARGPRRYSGSPTAIVGGGKGEQYNVRRTCRRASFLVTRLLANMGAAGRTPLWERFHSPVDASKAEKRWLDGLYVDVPEEWDDPYRFFRW